MGFTTTRIERFIDALDDLIERAAQAGATDVDPGTEHDAPGAAPSGGFTDLLGYRWSVRLRHIECPGCARNLPDAPVAARWPEARELCNFITVAIRSGSGAPSRRFSALHPVPTR